MSTPQQSGRLPGWWWATVAAVVAAALLVAGGWAFVLLRGDQVATATSADRDKAPTSTVVETTTVIETETVVAVYVQPDAPAPAVSTATVAPPASAAAPLDPKGGPRQDITCNSGYIVQVLSELTEADFDAHVARARGQGIIPADAKWALTEASCALFSSNVHLLYSGPYADPYAGCAVRLAGEPDSFIRSTDPADKDRFISCMCPATNLPELSTGSTQRQWVGELQRALGGRLNYTIPELQTASEWGVYGAGTQGAVSRFQADNGLTATGVVDAATWALIRGSLC